MQMNSFLFQLTQRKTATEENASAIYTHQSARTFSKIR